jgi:subtilisin family serine protease
MQIEKGSVPLNKRLERGIDNELVPIIVVMMEQYDTQKLYNEVKDLPKNDRREITVGRLKSFSNNSQKEIKAVIEKYRKAGMASDVTYHWLNNAIGLEAHPEVVVELNKRKDVERIEYDPLVGVIEGRNNNDIYEFDGARELPYHPTMVGAPALWEDGFWGQDVVVAVLDTGVNYDHTDLQGNLWIADGYPNYGWNFTSDNNDPKDRHGHGSHCAGIVAGNGASGVQSGIAPKAKIMCLKVIGDNSTQQSKVWESIEFAVEKGAHVLSMSFGWTKSNDPDRPSWRRTMENTLSAGVVASVGAGNEGAFLGDYPIPRNLRTPGDCPPPWINPEMPQKGGLTAVITSGASDSADALAEFSSRGPSVWDFGDSYNDYPYNPEPGLVKPDITSPGVEVLSLVYDSNTGYKYDSGTSMATPATAGSIALMLSKDPELTPEEICRLLETTANKYESRKNNQSGSGRTNVTAACRLINNDMPPKAPFLMYPTNQEKYIDFRPTLRWEKNYPTNEFFVYLGSDNPPTNVINGKVVTDKYFKLEEKLDPDKVYYWRIDAKNQYGHVEGYVWSFRTALAVNEDFESNGFKYDDWYFSTTGSGAKEWQISSESPYDGNYCLQSGALNNNSSTSVSINLNILEDGIVSFARKVSSELNSDFFRFFVGSTLLAEWSGEKEWEIVSFPVTAGSRTFRWTYSRDAMSSAGEDAVWIDNITFPSHPKPPVVYTPHSIDYIAKYGVLAINWDIEENEILEPHLFSFLGFDLYKRYNGIEEFTKVNEEYLKEKSYEEKYMTEGNYGFYVVAVYKKMGKIVESDPSKIIEFQIHPAITAPKFTPQGGEYYQEVTISLEANEKDVEIYYTLDGSMPNSHSTLYSEPFVIEKSAMAKAIAYKENHLESSVTQASYEIVNTGVEEINTPPLELSFNIYPNPFDRINNTARSSTLNIAYSLPDEVASLNFEVYNIKGQLVNQYRGERLTKGHHSVSIDFQDDRGKDVQSGVYLIVMKTDKSLLVKKIISLK